MSSHEIPDTPEGRINAARGYKAALHNPHVHDEAKQHAREMLDKLNEEEARVELHAEGGAHHAEYHRHRASVPEAHPRHLSPQERINSARGYKAAIDNPLVSAEGKEHARQMLKEMEDEEARQELYRQQEKQKSPVRVAAGLRAWVLLADLADAD
ncbi:Con-6 family protein [Aspergillus lucknowensis]|uniref:Conidiation protein Con-6 n=1 Tax=Aspergillus lucknowensis TaxID=176173 RepID=A0ABR4M1Y0_9EURO